MVAVEAGVAAAVVSCGSESADDIELEPTLTELIESKTLQWIFVGGKGGVGKTTTSCSIAIQLAKRRKDVLILSTDPAHNLSDAFGQKFSNQPTAVNGFENLYAMEIDPSVNINTAYTVESEDDLGFLKMIPELLSACPGVDEAIGFAELMEAVQTMNYSVIVFDTAPTGHTLRLLSFPDLLDKAVRKFDELKDSVPGVFSMFESFGGKSDSMGSKIENMRAVTASIRQVFRDPTKTTFVCVCIPEFLSLFETERLVQELTKNDMDASYIVVNQILFPMEGCENGLESSFQEGLDKYDSTKDDEVRSLLEKYKSLLIKAKALDKNHMARRKMQSKYLSQIRDLYVYDFHVVPMPLRSDEVRGIDSLVAFGQDLLTPKPLPIVSDQFSLE